MTNPDFSHTSGNAELKTVILADISCLFNAVKKSYNSHANRSTINRSIVKYMTKLKHEHPADKAICYDSKFPESFKNRRKSNNETNILHGELKNIGFETVSSPLMYRKQGIFEKGVDVKLAMDATELIHSGIFHRLIIVSGDGDFYPVAELAVRNHLEFIIIFPGKISSLYTKLPEVKITKLPLSWVDWPEVCD